MYSICAIIMVATCSSAFTNTFIIMLTTNMLTKPSTS